MQEIKLKKGKHLIVIKVPSNLSYEALELLSKNIQQGVDGLNVMVIQGETEMTVITLED